MIAYHLISTRFVFALGAAAACVFHFSPAFAGSDLAVRVAWVRATVPGQPVAAAYLTLQSASAVRLISATSEVAQAVEIHEMSLKDGVMRMRRLEVFDVRANQVIRMAPGGTHLMLVNLRRPLVAGEQVELDLSPLPPTANRRRPGSVCPC